MAGTTGTRRTPAASLQVPARGPVLACYAALLALWPSWGGAQTRDQYCGRGAAGFDRPLQVAHSDRYLNSTYGYSLSIPSGWNAYTSHNGPERGIVLTRPGDASAQLSVDALYDAYYDITAAGVHRRDLNTIRLHDSVLGDEETTAALAGVPGNRFRIHVQCSGQPTQWVHEELIVVRNREIYRVDLQSSAEHYEEYRAGLLTLWRSWRWEPLR